MTTRTLAETYGTNQNEKSILTKLFSGGGMLKSASSLLAGLNAVQANVLIADTNFTLIYANNLAIDTLRTIEGEIQSQFRVRVDEIVGGTIHRFHQNPQAIEKVLRDPRALPHTTEFSFGGVTLAAKINGIIDNNNKIHGYIVNWENITEKKVTEEKMAQMVSMVENSPSNIIYADLEFNIQYVNPASVKTLKTIEQYLPVRVDQLMGQSIDIFHKDVPTQYSFRSQKPTKAGHHRCRT